MINSTLKTQNLTNGVQSGSKLKDINQYSWLKIMLEQPTKENLSQAGFETLEDLYFELEQFIDFQIEDNIMKMKSFDFTQEDYSELEIFLSNIDTDKLNEREKAIIKGFNDIIKSQNIYLELEIVLSNIGSNKLNEREKAIIKGFNEIIKSQNIANLTSHSSSTSLNDFLFQEFLAQEIERKNEQSLPDNKPFYNSFEDITEDKERKNEQSLPDNKPFYNSFEDITEDKESFKNLNPNDESQNDDKASSYYSLNSSRVEKYNTENSDNNSFAGDIFAGDNLLFNIAELDNSSIKGNEDNSPNYTINNISQSSNQNKSLKSNQASQVISNTLDISDNWLEESVDNLPSNFFQSPLIPESNDSKIIPDTINSSITNGNNSINDDKRNNSNQSINESNDSKIIPDTINSSITNGNNSINDDKRNNSNQSINESINSQKINLSNYTNFNLTTSTPKSKISKIIPSKQSSRLYDSMLTPIKPSTKCRDNLESTPSFIKNQINAFNFKSPDIKPYYQEFLRNANNKSFDTRVKLRDKVDLNVEREQKKSLMQDQIHELRELDVKTWIDGFENFYQNGGAGEEKRLAVFKKLLKPDVHLNDMFQSSRLQKLASYNLPKDEELFKCLKNYALQYLALVISKEIANQTDTLKNTPYDANDLIMYCSVDSVQDAKNNVMQTLKASQSNKLKEEVKPQRSILKSDIYDNATPLLRIRNR
jgi:hypothetical protein